MNLMIHLPLSCLYPHSMPLSPHYRNQRNHETREPSPRDGWHGKSPEKVTWKDPWEARPSSLDLVLSLAIGD